MDWLSFVACQIQTFAQATGNFMERTVRKLSGSGGRRPIEILKRLQQESFSDIMKLRDRQDKLEKLLSLHRSGKGYLFNEASTRVSAEIGAISALMLSEVVNDHSLELLRQASIDTGAYSKFTIETAAWNRDALVAQFSTRPSCPAQPNLVPGQLALTKLMYLARINDLFSLCILPTGAHFRDIRSVPSSMQVQGLTDPFYSGQALSNQNYNCGVGVMLQESKYAASMGALVSSWWAGSSGRSRSISSFSEITYNLHRGAQISFTGLYEKPVGTGCIALLLNHFKNHEYFPNRALESSSFTTGQGSNKMFTVPKESLSFIMESEIDDSFKIGASIQLQISHMRNQQWKFYMSETPVNDIGWGVSVSRSGAGLSLWHHLQAEAFLLFRIGKRLSLKPSFVYAVNRKERLPALVLQSSWQL